MGEDCRYRPGDNLGKASTLQNKTRGGEEGPGRGVEESSVC
jgi:hypothetical protein